MTQTMVFVLEILGTVAFAASGALVGIEKRMDTFGVAMLGLTTAVGGGIIRDLILGITPPTTFRNPAYAATAVITAVILFIPAVRERINKGQKVFDWTMFLLDSIGLGLFTVIAIQTVYRTQTDPGVFLTVFVAVVTGVGGGVLRDVLAGNIPYIFIKHFYASSALIGAIVTVIIWDGFGEVPSMIAGALIVIGLRFLAARYRWKMPRA